MFYSNTPVDCFLVKAYSVDDDPFFSGLPVPLAIHLGNAGLPHVGDGLFYQFAVHFHRQQHWVLQEKVNTYRYFL